MTTIKCTSELAATVTSDVLVLGVISSADGPRLCVSNDFPGRASLESSLALLGMTGEENQVRLVPAPQSVAARILALTGLGPSCDGVGVSAGALRRAAGAATRAITESKSIAVALPALGPEKIAATAEGAALGTYAFSRLRSDSSGYAADSLTDIHVVTGPGETTPLEPTDVITEAVRNTRDLVNTPANALPPSELAQCAVDAARGLPVTVTVLDEHQLAEAGFGGILAVGQGSSRPPRLVRLDYKPPNATRHLSLVGKGITFDSGGISIKAAAGMEVMKYDMAGAAAVLHTVIAAARLALNIRITGWLALAENMPSGTALRPSDVITIYGGRTVEVKNTDAEGRLVLADALVAAQEENPDFLVDIATLTGAQRTALGTRIAGVMTNDPPFAERLIGLANAVDEPMWLMPLPDYLRESLKSRVADIANVGDPHGGMLTAGLFLREFVSHVAPETTSARPAWAHLDVCGPAFNADAAYGFTPEGATGVPVRTLIALAGDLVNE